MTPRTHTVLSTYFGRDGVQRVYVRDYQGALIAETPVSQGDRVVIQDGKAVAV